IRKNKNLIYLVLQNFKQTDYNIEEELFSEGLVALWNAILYYDPNNYDPNTISWYGVSSERFDTSSLPDWERCAYQFELCAWARITNGFYYIYGRCFRDHYYITF
ncbi:MAG: hypothetical protein ACMUHX_03305, partial [bacterium]